jgi:6-pyruvoyl tetrahydropterin synthase/QueD family protein
MLRLTREVRFTLPFSEAERFHLPGQNTLVGNLLDGPGMYCTLQVTLAGEVNPLSQYLEKIKEIDAEARRAPAWALLELMRGGKWTIERATKLAGDVLAKRWPGQLQGVRLRTNPFLWCDYLPRERPMYRLTQRFDFSAAHRLHNDRLDDATNVEMFGKCNNPAGHGHNYQFDVTLAGEPDESGRLISRDRFCEIVQRLVIDRFDHKHLNVQTSEFRDTIPSVENIAAVIYRLLKSELPTLHSVRVWETEKTSAEYREP